MSPMQPMGGFGAPAMADVGVSIVTYNSARWLPNCLAALAAQTRSLIVCIVDNASTDDSVSVVRRLAPAARVVTLQKNLGYCAAQNIAIRALGEVRHVLTLNADAVLSPAYAANLAQYLDSHPRCAAVTGQLLQMCDRPGDLLPARWDHAGFYVLPLGRTLDWAQGRQVEDGFSVSEPFGVSGAAAMYRLSALKDVEIDGEIMDESFFAYADDVDLAWRLQLRGWSAACVASAVAWHARQLPARGAHRHRPRLVACHLHKNRNLLWIKNFPMALLLRQSPWLVIWMIVQILFAAVYDRRGLMGFLMLARCLPRAWRWRSKTQTRAIEASRAGSWIAEGRRIESTLRRRGVA